MALQEAFLVTNEEIDSAQRHLLEDAYAEGYVAASEGLPMIPTLHSPTVMAFTKGEIITEYNYRYYTDLMVRFGEGYSEWFEPDIV